LPGGLHLMLEWRHLSFRN